MAERTYSDREMAALLKRAAKLQTNAARQAENQSGLTLEELETIAAEAGLDPIHLRQAASELFEPDIHLSHQNADTSASHNFVEQWVVGELNDESWEEAEAELRHRYDSDMSQMMMGGMTNMGGVSYGKGHASKIGKTREWKHMSMSGIETRVSVQPRGESLQIKLSQRVGWGGIGAESTVYGAIIAAIAALIAGGATSSLLIGFSVLLGTLLAAIPLIYYADSKWRAKKHKEMKKLGLRLASMFAEHVPEEIATTEMKYEELDEQRIDAGLLEENDASKEQAASSGKARDRNSG